MLLCISLADWGSIANIVLAGISVFTAIVTACMLCKQHKLQQKQYTLDQEKLKVQQLEHQPMFKFVKEADSLTIVNNGGCLCAPIKAAIESMIIVHSEKLINKTFSDYVFCWPVRYYYRKGQNTHNLLNDLAKFQFNEVDYRNLVGKVGVIRDSLLTLKRLPPNAPITTILSVTLSDLIRIEYVDMYKKSHTVYYLDTQMISKKEYNKFIEISRKLPNGIYDVNSVNVEDVIDLTYATNHKFDV